MALRRFCTHAMLILGLGLGDAAMEVYFGTPEVAYFRVKLVLVLKSFGTGSKEVFWCLKGLEMDLQSSLLS